MVAKFCIQFFFAFQGLHERVCCYYYRWGVLWNLSWPRDPLIPVYIGETTDKRKIKRLPPERKHFVFKDSLVVRQQFYHRREGHPTTEKHSLNSKNCIQRKTKFLSRWKTIAAKLINSMRERCFCSSSLFRKSQQLGRPKCTQSIFSTQSIVQFLINPSGQWIP